MPSNSVRLFIFTVFLWGMATVSSLALDIPVFARAATSNQSSWYPDREGRSLDWDEKYLFAVGIDSLRQADFGLDLEIRAEERLDSFHPVIHTFLLSWVKNSHSLELGTQNIGLASAYDFARRFVAYHAYDGWLFEATRLNAVGYGYHHGFLDITARLGGNQISRGIALLGIGLTPYNQEISAGIRATVSDSHWHSPSLISNLKLKLDLDAFSHNTDLMMKQVLPHNDRPAREEYALASEIAYRFSPRFSFVAGGLYEEREFAPRRISEFHTALDWSFGKLTLSPCFSSKTLTDSREDSYGALLRWAPLPQVRCDLVYKYETGPYDENRHVFAVQTDLRFDF
ncbi:MAG: hypothetical protein KBA79_01045 [Candidatus Cloacimonetes bacterium]|nr:hypothetical protein [Candidatus Cloacimonadota bacterium]